MVRARQVLVAEMQSRGVRGGRIRPHRAMAGVRMTPMLIVHMVALPALLTAALLLAMPWIADLWLVLFRWLAGPLALGTVGVRVVTVGDVYALAIPYAQPLGEWPTSRQLAIAAGTTVAGLVATVSIPARHLPLRYLVRAIGIIQLIAVSYFAFARPPFPYTLPGYTVGFLTTGAATLTVLPAVLGLTFFLFDLSVWHKLALTTMVLVHLAVLLPLQVIVHAYLVAHASFVVLPTLFLVFGLLLEVAVFVAFYGWGMSWGGSDRR